MTKDQSPRGALMGPTAPVELDAGSCSASRTWCWVPWRWFWVSYNLVCWASSIDNNVSFPRNLSSLRLKHYFFLPASWTLLTPCQKVPKVSSYFPHLLLSLQRELDLFLRKFDPFLRKSLWYSSSVFSLWDHSCLKNKCTSN